MALHDFRSFRATWSRLPKGGGGVSVSWNRARLFRDLKLLSVRIPRLAFGALAVVAETAMSRRGLAVVFLLLALLVLWSGWLRPPLSRDLSAFELPLGGWFSSSHSAEEILAESPGFAVDSIGGILMVLLLAALPVVLLRPQWTGVVAGILLAVVIGGNAAATLNHPELIQLLDSEATQRWQMVRMTGELRENTVARFRNARAGPVRREYARQADWRMGGAYLLYGPWLAGLAGIGVLYASRGSAARRLGKLAGWAVVGGVAAGAICLPRLRAESYWLKAKRLELRGDIAASRNALQTARNILPELDSLARTWRLVGKLDYFEGRSTPQERFWRAGQLAKNRQWDQAVALINELLKDDDNCHTAVRDQAARLLVSAGLSYYRQGRITAARDFWSRVKQLDPRRFDCAFYLGMTRMQIAPDRPDLVLAEFAPILARSADRPLCADILVVIGDAYFQAGEMQVARRCYARSLEVFSLPKTINFRAYRGLTGL